MAADAYLVLLWHTDSDWRNMVAWRDVVNWSDAADASSISTGSMAEQMPIINLGDLAKPATLLIEKISDAVGAVFAPHQRLRMAKADAEVALIQAKTKVEVTDLDRRAMARFVREEARKQENIESITSKAIPQLEDNSQPQKMDDDWITNFFEKCRIVSDQEMQTLWARVLAGEANAPGAFSKRTVNFMSSLDKRDAYLFGTLCSFAWTMGEPTPLIFDPNNEVYSNAGINFGALTHLANIGLIRFEGISGFVARTLPQRLVVFYFGTPIGLVFQKENDNAMDLGHVLLSQVGKELAAICGPQPNALFLEQVISRWRDLGLSPFSPFPRRSATA